ncbi:MAG: GreA/GreB family elongation factor [Bacteroidota bacterium]
MSRGFVKEDDQEDIPIVPPRAELPNGVTNYVTPAGWDALLSEKQMLTDEKNQLNISSENERRIALNHINAKLHLLNNRIAEAKIIDLKEQPQNEIRFGARVTFRIEATKTVQTFQIVGVDEADIAKGKISFLSPLAKALLNKKKGEKAILKTGREERVFDVIEITYG